MRQSRFPFSISGFTLIEALIVVAFIAVVASFLLGGNFMSALQKGRDSRRKQDLHKLTRMFEDYYNDKGGYPPNDQTTGTIKDAPWGVSFSPYLSSLPKDPISSPEYKYYYQTDPNVQNFFVLYAKLENSSDKDIEMVGCKNGCGPDLAYNYVVHSPNIVMLAGLPQGAAPTGAGGGGEGGGPGGGGGGSPSPTGGPSVTSGLPPTGPSATPTSPPGAGCSFGQCGACQKCGGFSVGVDCGWLQRCWYPDSEGNWWCKFDIGCLF